MKAIFEKNRDVAVLMARVIIGGIFLYSGWIKVADMAMTIGFFSSIGIPVFLTYIVAYGEVIAGALIILGIWLECAVGFSAIIMFVAVYITRGMGPDVVMTPLSVLGGLLAIASAGAGKYRVKCQKFASLN